MLTLKAMSLGYERRKLKYGIHPPHKLMKIPIHQMWRYYADPTIPNFSEDLSFSKNRMYRQDFTEEWMRDAWDIGDDNVSLYGKTYQYPPSISTWDKIFEVQDDYPEDKYCSKALFGTVKQRHRSTF